MEVVSIVCIAIGVLGVAFAVRFYIELRRWAHHCKYARIAIAYKGKVKLHAPLTEWVAWVNMLDKDKDSQGRVIYRAGGTSVAITKAVVPPGKLRQRLNERRRAKSDTTVGPKVREGSWSAEDQTPTENKVKT